MVNPLEAIKNGFVNYFNFSGRSTRAEYWWWYLFLAVLSLITTTADKLLHITIILHTGGNASAVTNIGYGYITSTVLILTFLPNIALAIRRLHDAGRYWFWLPLSFLPFINILVFVFYCSASTKSGWGKPTSPKNPSLTGLHLAKD